MTNPHAGVSKGTLTVHVGDTHVGSSVALCPPKVALDDGGFHYATPVQRWFWDCWVAFWEDTKRLKDVLGVHALAVFGGDLRDGDHHGTTQLWASNEQTQDRAVYDTLEVAEDVIDAAVFIRGTEAHSGPASAAEERYAEYLSRKWRVWRNGDLYSFWIWTAEVEGVKFQVKHQPGTMSYVPHTRDAAAARQAQYTWEEYHKAGDVPPDVAIFHHVHVRGRGYYENLYCHYVPSWQLPSNWIGHRLSSPRIEWPGGLRLHVQNGTYTSHELRFKPRSAVAWMQ